MLRISKLMFLLVVFALHGNSSIGQALSLSLTTHAAQCVYECGANGEIIANASGGAPPYSYAFVPNDPGSWVAWLYQPDHAIVSEGSFIVTVYDAQNDSVSQIVSVIDNDFAVCMWDVDAQVVQYACDGQCNGIIRIPLFPGFAGVLHAGSAYSSGPDSVASGGFYDYGYFFDLCPDDYDATWYGVTGCVAYYHGWTTLQNAVGPAPISVSGITPDQNAQSVGSAIVDISTSSVPFFGRLYDSNGSQIGLSLSPGVTTLTGLPADDYLVIRFMNCADACGCRDTVQFTIPVAAPQLLLEVKAMLSGPLNGATMLMDDGMRANGQLPLTEPYSALGYTQAGNGATAINDATVLNTTGNDAIVDWVVLELRSPTDPAAIEHSRYCLIQRDGDVVDVDGVSPVGFEAPAGQFFVAMRHRNHLGAMAANTVSLSTISTQLDLTSTGTAIWGTDAMQDVNGTICLWSGDVNFDGALKYTGADNDRDAVLIAIGGNNPTAVLSNSYSPEDLNMDGEVKYTGSSNDRDLILVNIGGSDPTAVRVEQLP